LAIPRIKTTAKVSISILLLTFFLFYSGFGGILQALLSIPAWVVLISFVLYFSSLLVSSAKWKILLESHSFSDLVVFNMIGLYYGILLPGQLPSEGVKGYMLMNYSGDSRKIFASILMDRITGLIGLLVVAFAGILLSTQDFSRGFLLILMAGTFLSVGVFLSLNSRPMSALADRILLLLSTRVPRINGMTRQVHQILSDWRTYYSRPYLLFTAVLLGIIYQCISAFGTMIVAEAIGIHLSITDWFWVTGVVALILLAPFTIGGLGLREGSYIGLLELFHIAGSKSLVLSLVLFSIQVVGALIGGILMVRVVLGKRRAGGDQGLP
jgi:uncharacterized protein (TIRG00374 family)